MNLKTFIKVSEIALILIIVATLIFIYTRSMKSQEESKEESDHIGEIVGEIVPPETKPGAFLQTNIRKLAHFTEFFVLGIEISLYVCLFLRKKTYAFLVYPTGMILAFFDESIQMFTGRGPQISDVWIDFFGYAISMTCTYLVFTLVLLVIKKRRNRREV